MGVGAELAGGEALAALAELVGLAERGAVAAELRGDFGAGLADAHGGYDGEGAVAGRAGEVGREAGAEDARGRAPEEGAGGGENQALVEAADGGVVGVGGHERYLGGVGDGAEFVRDQLLDSRVEAESGNHEGGPEMDQESGNVSSGRLGVGGGITGGAHPPRKRTIQASAPRASLEAPSIRSRSESFLRSELNRIHFIWPMHSAMSTVRASFPMTPNHESTELRVMDCSHSGVSLPS